MRFDEIQSRNAMNLSEALVVIPGVQMAGNQVNIRGSSGFSYGVGSRVLMLIDGIPVLGSDTGDIKLDGLPMQMVERLEIIKGPGSALYGSGALGGIVNLITRPASDKATITVRQFVGYSQPVTHRAWREGWDEGDEWRRFDGTTLAVSGPAGRDGSYWINGVYRYQSGWLEFQRDRSYEVTGKYFKRLRSGKADVYVGLRRGIRQNHLYWEGLDDPLSIGRVALGSSEAVGGNDAANDMLLLAPTYSRAFGEKWTIAAKTRILAGRIIKINDDGTLNREDAPSYGVRYGADIQANWIGQNGITAVFGVMQDGNAIFSDWYGSDKSMQHRIQPENGIYTQVSRSSSTTSISAGMRYDGYRIEEIGLQQRISPKLALSHSLSDQLLFRFSAGSGFRVPSVSERFVDNNDFLPLKPNPELRPEISNGFDTGVRSFFNFGKNIGGQLDFSFFWNEYRRLVEPKFNQSLGSFQFQNLTAATIRGGEFLFETASLNRDIYARIGYTRLFTRDHSNNQQLFYRSEHQLTVSGGVTFFKSIQAGFDYRYLSKPERTDSDFNRFVRDADKVVPIHVVDLRLLYKGRLRNTNWSVSMIGRNITNYYHVERPAVFAQPRSVMMQIQVSV
jgi:iron complex outermembrane receptor protein